MSDLGLQPRSATAAALDRISGVVSGGAAPLPFTPRSVRDFLSTGSTGNTPIVKQLPQNLTSLQNKYTELAPIINALPVEARDALLGMDSDRVARGSQPLTREETLKLAQTWVTQEPTTPEPEPSALNLPGNLLRNLSQTLQAIPQIPAGLINEVQSLGEPGTGTGIEAIASAPGIRMLPGMYIAENVAQGDFQELAQNPLFTALDVLPIAGSFAKTTKVGKLAQEAADQAGRSARPLAAWMTQYVDETGQLADRAPRAVAKNIRDTTRVGQSLDSILGNRARQTSRIFEEARMQVTNQVHGLIDAGDDMVADATQRAFDLNTRYMDDYGWDADRFAGVSERMQLGKVTDPAEMAYKRDFDELTVQIGDELVAIDELSKYDGEYYTNEQGHKLIRSEERADHYGQMHVLRNEWRTPSGRLESTDLHEAMGHARRVVNTKYKTNEWRSIINVADAYGIDVTDARKALSDFNRKIIDEAELTSRVRGAVDAGWEARRTRLTATELIDLLHDVKRTGGKKGLDIQAVRLQSALASGEGAEITKRLGNIMRRKGSDLSMDTIDDIRSLRDRFAQDKNLKPYTARRAEQARSSHASLRNRTAPARFGRLIKEHTMEGITGEMIDPARVGVWRQVNIKGARQVFREMEELQLGRQLTADEAAASAQALAERRWGHFDFGEGVVVADFYKGIEREVAQTWKMLRDQGIDPSFVHVTTKGRVSQTLRPRVGPVPANLSQVKERAADFTPGINNPGVALTHQGVEILSRRASEEALDHVIRQFGIQESQLREMYAVPARAAAEADPFWGFEGQLSDIVQRQYTAITPDRYRWKARGMNQYDQTTYFVPKSVSNVLEALDQPKQLLGGVFDPVTKMFRMSVVGLSPRTQLYNVLGGAVMLLGEAGPGAFKYMQEAFDMARNPAKITDESLLKVIGSQREIMRDMDDLTRTSDRVRKAQATMAVQRGKSMARIWNEIQDSKVKGAAVDTVGKAASKMYDWNGQIDDMYRIMGYLHGKSKAQRRGLSKEAAQAAGEEMLRKSMMDWASLTPVERGVLKSVFPFYSFMNHAIRYVMRYPIDHPMRAGVLGAWGRAAEEDLDLLPDRFLGYAFTDLLPHEQGKQAGFNVGPVNPFGDVANMLTISGFLSATNPAIATALESVGLDRGEAELYPSLRYDPESGRLSGQRSNPLLGFVQNTVPQSSVLLSMLGANTEFNERIRQDPAAAHRMLLSGTGMPILWRQFDTTQEVMKAELARQRSQRDVLNDALKSGNFTEAERYPNLQGISGRVGQLPDAVTQAFTPPEAQAIRSQLETLLAGQGATFNVDGVDSDVARAALETVLAPSGQVSMGGI